MVLHDRANRPTARSAGVGERRHGLRFGERLEAELAHEAVDVAIDLERLAAVPDFPEMDVAAVGRAGHVIASAGRGGGPRRPARRGRACSNRRRSSCRRSTRVPLPRKNMISLLPHQTAIDGWCRRRAMLSRASCRTFFRNAVVEGRIGRAAELQIEPDANALLVARVEEGVVLVVAAAPEPQRSSCWPPRRRRRSGEGCPSSRGWRSSRPESSWPPWRRTAHR